MSVTQSLPHEPIAAAPATPLSALASANDARERERQRYETHRAELLGEIDPIGAMENDLFEHLLAASWRFRRFRSLEEQIYQNEPDPLANPAAAQSLDRLARYQAAAERSYHRAFQALKELQTNNAQRDLTDHPVLQQTSGLVSVEKVRKYLPDLSAPAPTASAARPAASAAPTVPAAAAPLVEDALPCTPPPSPEMFNVAA